MKVKEYQFGLNVFAIILFVLVMIPNLIWFFVPSQNDVLRNESVTKILDVFGSIFQVFTVAALCAFRNEKAGKLQISLLFITSLLCLLFYYVFWILYYCNYTHAAVLIGLSIFPCASFLLYGKKKKNYIALIPAFVFTVLHSVSTIINFII